MQQFYPESRFGGFTDVDGTVAFYVRVGALLSADSVVLDIGCGRGAAIDDRVPTRKALRILQGKARTVVGIDVDPAAAENPFVDDFRLVQGPAWPIETASIDLAIADFVLEHVEDPDAFFAECARVVKPGGVLCLRTPNAWSYIGLLARLIPNRRHHAVLRTAQPDRKAEDAFPTLYRCNTASAIRRQMARYGFDGCAYGYEAEPSYLAFSRAAYALGVLHQRLAPGIVRATIFAWGRRL